MTHCQGTQYIPIIQSKSMTGVTVLATLATTNKTLTMTESLDTSPVSFSLMEFQVDTTRTLYSSQPDVPRKTSIGRSEDSTITEINQPPNNDDNQETPTAVFLPTQCLFCNTLSTSFSENAAHMRKRHGLLVPSSIDDGELVLAVDLETIIGYMHLVIFDWQECLFCHSQRQSPHAVQQHMMGKGHCRVDLQEADSEFRDFYESVQIHDEVEESESKNEDEEAMSSIPSEDEGRTTQRTRSFAIQDGKLSLAPGRRLAHRSAPTTKSQRHRPLAESSRNLSRRGIHSILEELKLDSASEFNSLDVASAAAPSSPSSPGTQTQALTRTERRLLTHNKSALTVALSKMSNRDRSALSHLSAAEKRATIVTQFKQQDRARVAERRYRSKMEGRGNQVLMEHFKMDVPGPKLG